MKYLIGFMISTWYIWLVMFIVLGALYQIFFPRIMGYLGEKSVSVFLSRLDQSKYKVIHNVMLRINGKTTQIDHIVVSNFGIFVIETKNYKGWIMGNEYDEFWTQVIFKHREKLYNPIRQNYGHIKALESFLSEFPGIPYISIVVFTTKADLKVTASTDIVYTVNIPKTIRKYNDERVTDDIRDKIFNMLSSKNVLEKEERKKHIEDIHTRMEDREDKIEQGICPKCGKRLVVRNGKYGSFTGCSGYPACKFKIGGSA